MCAALLLTALQAPAGSVVRVEGEVTLEGERLPGVTVAAFNERTWLPGDSSTTDGTGYYIILLQPGVYSIRFSLEGFQTRDYQHVDVQVGAPVRLSVKLRLAGTSEEITIQAQAPVIRETSPSALVTSLATNALQISSALRTATTWLSAMGLGEVVPTMIGVSPEVTLDGTKVPEAIAATAAQSDSIRVLRGALAAEFGGGASGTLVVVPESGAGNELAIDVSASVQPESLRGEALGVVPPFTAGESSRRDFDLRLGSPVVRDRLWVFATYRSDLERLVHGTGSPAEERGGGRADLSDTNLMLRIDGNLGTLSLTNRFVLTSRAADGFIGDFLGHLHAEPSAATHERDERVAGDVLTASLMLENALYTVTGESHNQRESFAPVDTPGAVQQRDVPAGFFARGGPGLAVDGVRRTLALSGTASIYFRNAHDASAGGGRRQRNIDLETSLSGGALIDEYGSTELRRFSTLAGAAVSATRDDVTRADTFLYLQDSMRFFNGRLNVDAGVRLENADHSRADLRYETRILLPRLAAAYDVRGNGRIRVLASYGAYQEELSDHEVIGLLRRYGLGVRRSEEGPVDVVFDAASQVAGDLRPRWSDELTLGSSYSGARFFANASVQFRKLRDDIARAACGTAVCIGNPGHDLLDGVSPRRRSRTTQVTVGKSGWLSFRATYTHATLEGNVEPRVFPETHFAADPYLDPRRAFLDTYREESGPLHADRRHSLSVSGSHHIGRLQLGAFGYWKSGSPISRYGVSDRLASYPTLLAPRGSEGRTPDVFDLSLSTDYVVSLRYASLHFQVWALNVLDMQRPLLVDERWAFREADNTSPAPANPRFGEPIVRTPPRTIRLGVRITY